MVNIFSRRFQRKDLTNKLELVESQSTQSLITPSRAHKIVVALLQSYNELKDRIGFVEEHGGSFKAYGLKKRL